MVYIHSTREVIILTYEEVESAIDALVELIINAGEYFVSLTKN